MPKANVALPFKGVYGEGSLDAVVEKTIGSLAKTNTGRAALTVLASGLGEGNEEIVSDLVNPLAKILYTGQTVGESYKDNFSLSNTLHDGIVGALMGLSGGSANLVQGVRADVYTAGLGHENAAITSDLITEGLKYKDGSAAKAYAVGLAAKMESATTDTQAKAVTDYERGLLSRLMAEDAEEFGPAPATDDEQAALTQALNLESTVITPMAQTLIDSGVETAEAVNTAGQVQMLLDTAGANSAQGGLSNRAVDAVVKNSVVRAIISEKTGVNLPNSGSIASRRAAFRSAAAQYQTYQAQQEAARTAEEAQITQAAAPVTADANAIAAAQAEVNAKLAETRAATEAQPVTPKAAKSSDISIETRKDATTGTQHLIVRTPAGTAVSYEQFKAAVTTWAKAHKTTVSEAKMQTLYEAAVTGRTAAPATTKAASVKSNPAVAFAKKTAPAVGDAITMANGTTLTRSEFYDYAHSYASRTGTTFTDAQIEAMYRQAARGEGKKFSVSELVMNPNGVVVAPKDALHKVDENAELYVRGGMKLNDAQRWTGKLILGTKVHTGITTVVYDASLKSANAMVSGTTVYLNPTKLTTQAAITWTLGHELTHPAAGADRSMADDVIKAFQSTAMDLGTDTARGKAFWQKYMSGYETYLQHQTELYRKYLVDEIGEDAGKVDTMLAADDGAYMKEEVAADWMRDVFFERNMLNQLAGYKPGVIVSALEKIQSIQDDMSITADAKQARTVGRMANALYNRFRDALDVAAQMSTRDGKLRLSLSEDTPWGDQVKQVLAGTWPNSGNALYIAETPKFLRALGFREGPICATEVGLINAHNTLGAQGEGAHSHGHGVSQETLIKIPELLKHPVIAYDSPTEPGKVIVVTSELDSQGNPVVAVLDPNGHATIDWASHPVSFIKTIYGMGNFFDTATTTGRLSRAINAHALLFIDKEKSQDLLGSVNAFYADTTDSSSAEVYFPGTNEGSDFIEDPDLLGSAGTNHTGTPDFSSAGVYFPGTNEGLSSNSQDHFSNTDTTGTNSPTEQRPDVGIDYLAPDRSLDYNRIIRHYAGFVNTDDARMSIDDTDAFGTELTEAQQRFFADSYARDGFTKSGKLLRFYRGSEHWGHSFHDPALNRGMSFGTYWTTNFEVAQLYAQGAADFFGEGALPKQTLEEVKAGVDANSDVILRPQRKANTVAESALDEYREALRSSTASGEVASAATNPALKTVLTGMKKQGYLSVQSPETFTVGKAKQLLKTWLDADAGSGGPGWDKYEALSNLLDDNVSDWEDESGLGGRVYEDYLNIRRPYILDCEGASWGDLTGLSEYEGDTTDDIARAIHQEGLYDSVVFRNVVDGAGVHVADEVVTFAANQSKSTANTAPTGARDERFSVSDTLDKVEDDVYNRVAKLFGGFTNGTAEQEASTDHPGRQDTGRIGSGGQILRDNGEAQSRARNDRQGDLGGRAPVINKVGGTTNGTAESSIDNRRKDSGRIGSAPMAGGPNAKAVYGGSESEGHLGRGHLLGDVVLSHAGREQYGVPDVGLSVTKDHSAFSTALDDARAANLYGALVDPQTVEELAERKTVTFLTDDGSAGVAIQDDGNIVGVFKNSARNKTKNVVRDLLLTAVANGGDHLDCYMTVGKSSTSLVKMYTELGFEPVAWSPFNREYAPTNWDYARYGEPDVVMMVHDSTDVDTVAQNITHYHSWTADEIHALPEFSDYDEAKTYQAEQLNKIKAAQGSTDAGAISLPRYSVDDDTTVPPVDFTADMDAFMREFYGAYMPKTQSATGTPKKQVSQVRSNTFRNSGVFTAAEKGMKGLKPKDMTYDVVTEQESIKQAKQRLSADYAAEKAGLPKKTGWSGTDLDVSMGVLATELQAARQTGNMAEVVKWARTIRKMGTQSGQMIQAFAKYTRTAEGVVVRAAEDLEKTKLPKAKKDELMKKISQFAETLQTMQGGDKQGLVDLIVRQAQVRQTPVSNTTLRDLGMQKFDWLYDAAMTQLDQIAKDYINPGVGKKISTYQIMSHLMNMRTALRNVVSNQVFDVVDSSANNVGMLYDGLLGLFTRQRGVGFQSGWFSEAKRKGAMDGLRKAWIEASLDIAPEGSHDKYGTARRTWKMAGGTASKALSTAEKAMGFELNVTDEFHKGSVAAEVTESLAKYVAAGYMTQEQAEQFAKDEALYRSFQDDTYIGKLLGNIKKIANTVVYYDFSEGKMTTKQLDFGLGDIIQKYTQVPGALLTRAIEFSPLGYLKAIYMTAQIAHQTKTDTGASLNAQRMAALSMGRATTGTGLICAFAALALAGLLRRQDDEEDADAKALSASEGLTGTQLNVSALGRLIGGGSGKWQKGDTLMGIDFLEPLNSLMSMGTLIAQDDDAKGLWGKAKAVSLDSIQALYSSLSDIPTMQTIQTVQDTIKYHQDDDPTPLWAEIPIEVGTSGITGFIPSLVRQTAQATDPYYRDAYTTRNTADQVWANIKSGIPGARNTLPVKETNFGTAKKQENTGLRVVDAFLTPGSIRTYQQSSVSKSLAKVYSATEDASIYPDRNAPYKLNVTIDGEDQKYNLGAKARQTYQKTRGRTTYQLIKDSMGTASYDNAGNDDKATILKDIKNYANYTAKKEYLAGKDVDYADTQYEKISDALNAGIVISDYVTIMTAAGAQTSDKDADGKTISGSKKTKVLTVINGYDLTKEQKDIFYYNMGYAESTIGDAPWH
mgnify:CR=1 FL=1